MGDAAVGSLSNGCVAEKGEADGEFGADHGEAVGEVADPPELEGGGGLVRVNIWGMGGERFGHTLSAIIMPWGVRSFVSLPVPWMAPPMAEVDCMVCMSWAKSIHQSSQPEALTIHVRT